MKIIEPTLILDEVVCKNNIQMMSKKANDHHLQFWPHFKTHASAQIGKWFKDEGIQKATVSSIKMAKYFIHHGWQQLHIAFPFVINAILEFKTLSEKCQITVNVVNGAQVDVLASIGTPIGLFIEIDAGYGRVGLSSGNYPEIERLIGHIEQWPNLKFEGFYLHSGQNYAAASVQEILENHRYTQDQLGKLKTAFGQNLTAVMGDTPGCSLASDFSQADVISPGNFTFYDLMQSELGSCSLDQIAVSMLCPVVAIDVDEQRIVIHGGAVHFSKDFIEIEGNKCFGKVKTLQKLNCAVHNIQHANLISLSQEHGIVQFYDKQLAQIEIGDLLEIIPVHSCLTAQCMKSFTLKNGQVFQTMF